MLIYHNALEFFSRLFIAFLCSTILLSSSSAKEQTKPSLILGVHPYLNPQELKQRFTPLADYLSKEVNQTVEVRIGRNYEEHLQAICLDEVDIAFLGPAPYVKLSSHNNTKPLLAKFLLKNKDGYYGHIITRKDSDIKRISDLSGKSFAFGDPNSTMSHLLPRYLLQHESIFIDDLSYSQFLNSHRNVAHAVLSGDFDAGAVKNEIYKEFIDKGLRELAITPLIPPHLFIASSQLPNQLIQKLKKAMLKIHKSESNNKLLQSIHHQLIALVPVQDSDYDLLRTILNQISIDK